MKVVLEMTANSIQQEHLEVHCNKTVNHKVIHIYTQMTDLFLHFFLSLNKPQMIIQIFLNFRRY